MSQLQVHLVQMTSCDSLTQNIQHLKEVLTALPRADRPTLVALPENALFLRSDPNQNMLQITVKDPVFDDLKHIAEKKNFFIHVGSAPILVEDRFTNASILISPAGNVQVSYEKLHLFDIQLESGLSLRESDVFHHGILPKTFWISDWLIGQSICYDIRFSELYNFYARIPVDAILIPSAFLVPTGQAHWHILNRARAIESQCYIISAAQAGKHPSSSGKERISFGYSLVVDPWGDILAEGSPDRPQVLSVTLDKSRIHQVRKQIPMHHHRRYHL
ncbi:MAG: carbon-nitrogen hydrolase family protein [Bdellovibrionaceae bacterium]|nr:carbon-nitrogen hydrolase family protein [Pseudobdellovibrionaceae bacterium]MDW8189447.1 nitrilase-related carbon-nitrogen hydrolase [Pseudobdellovibrionaceae bacterium]